MMAGLPIDKRITSHGNLLKFREAKNEMSKIIKDISEYMQSCDQICCNIQKSEERFHDIIPSVMSEKLHTFKEKIVHMKEVIGRNQMKCAFFGRTSNGKSTVINAILGAKILPSGIGHTTNCFLEIAATDLEKGYIQKEGSNDHKPIESINELGNALSNIKMTNDSLIHIYWPPSNTCSILREEVVLLDSPGVDIDPDMDSWIEKHCLDADVFVLVANAESTLMQAEKKFFHKVNEKLSQQNIFILNNRWDCSAEEEDMDDVRKQHMQRCRAFLIDELGATNSDDVNKRIFFVSAKEVLTQRLKRVVGGPCSGDMNPAAYGLAEGWHERLTEFTNFEDNFEKILSESAIKTKFSSHARECQTIITTLRNWMENIYDKSIENREAALKLRENMQNQISNISVSQDSLNETVDKEFENCLSLIEQFVAESLQEDISRLNEIVTDFEKPFPVNCNDLASREAYKKGLNIHMEDTLGQRLEKICTRKTLEQVSLVDQFMLNCFLSLPVSKESRQKLSSMPLSDIPLKMDFHIDCRNICADFRGDVSFRFSLGLMNLLRLFKKSKNSYVRAAADASAFPLVTSAFSFMITRNSLGVALFLGTAVKLTGWRILGIVGLGYGGLYLIEWFTWTRKAQERSYKRQYVNHASYNLRLMVDYTVSNISHQVKQHLMMKKTKYDYEIEINNHVLFVKMDELSKDIDKLESITAKSKILKSTTNFIENCLASFTNNFIVATWVLS